MTTTTAEKVIADEDVGVTGKGIQTKRIKQKGAAHALHWEILDNVEVQAEDDWEAEAEECWTSKTCKKYVKMYHIDKLWPRQCHESHTKSFACKPWMCKDDHFIHRAQEVWQALFGDRPRSKGLLNYSLVSMVYTELILKRKVDWTTFPTTAQFPLRIGRTQKHIPDLYNPESVLTKSILERMKRRPHGPTIADVEPQMHEVPVTTDAGQSSIHTLERSVSLMQSPDPSHGGGHFSKDSLEGKTVAPESGEKLEIVAGNIFSTMFPKSYSTEKAAAGPTHSSIQGTGLEEQEDILTATHGGKSVGPADTNFPKVPTTECNSHEAIDTGPSTAMPTGSEVNLNDLGLPADVITLLLNKVQTMPNQEELKRLLDFTKEMAKLFRETVGQPDAESSEANDGRLEDGGKSEVLRAVHDAYIMKEGAQIIAAMAPDFVHMARTFLEVTPWVLKGAVGFQNFTEVTTKLLRGRAEDVTTIMKLEERTDKDSTRIKALKSELESYKLTNTVLANKLHKKYEETSNKTADAEVRGMDAVLVGSSTHTEDSLALSKYKEGEGVDVLLSSGEGTSQRSSGRVGVEIGYSQVQCNVQGKEKGIVHEGQDMESMVLKLEVANKERDDARAELASLRKTLATVDYTPCHENTMPWLGWVHRLQDRETMVSRAAHSLKKAAAESKASGELVEASVQRFKNTIGGRAREPTRNTIWGDVAEMMDRTSYYRNGKSTDIDWSLEVEEGWVPFNIFSSHFEESKRTVIHTCDPVPPFLNDKCSLCQEHFGPEGAYTLGQCGHNFHITCISESSMRQSVCPMCRSPFSTRFYEMMGLRDVMPPGHEFNRWNLPLDQLPKKFLNYREWGKPLIWNSEFSSHQLHEEFQMECDPFFWMTQDYEVEVRAREIEDGEQREMFCRNFGGHWSKEQKRFFRFPPKKVEKGDDGSWHEVEDDIVFGEEYKKYNRTLVGRALFLSKLEEAAKVRSSVDEASFKDVGCCYWDAVHAFDRRIGEVIEYWRNKLQKPHEELLISFQENDEFVKKVVGRVEKAMEILAAKRVDLGGKRKRDDGSDSDDSWESEMRTEIAAIDREYEGGGRIARRSQRPQTRSRTERERMNDASSSEHPILLE